MEVNVGSWDRGIRAIIGIIALVLAVLPYMTGNFVFLVSNIVQLVIFGLIGVIMLFTAVTAYCPLYKLFGFSTCPVSSRN